MGIEVLVGNTKVTLPLSILVFSDTQNKVDIVIIVVIQNLTAAATYVRSCHIDWTKALYTTEKQNPIKYYSNKRTNFKLLFKVKLRKVILANVATDSNSDAAKLSHV